MKKVIILSIVLSSCAQLKHSSNEEIEIYCQDLNVLYQKIAVISSNIINANTTRTAAGGPYKKKLQQTVTKEFVKLYQMKPSPS